MSNKKDTDNPIDSKEQTADSVHSEKTSQSDIAGNSTKATVKNRSSAQATVQSSTSKPSEIDHKKIKLTEPDARDSKTLKVAGSKPKKGRKGLLLFIVVLFVLCFTALAGGAYVYLEMRLEPLSSKSSNQASQISNHFTVLQSQLSNSKKESQQLKNELTRQSSNFKQQISQLSKRLSIESNKNPVSWTLAEVDYLLKLANQRLVTSRDTTTAIAILQSTDQILKELSYPEFTALRRQIAADITRLKLSSQLDYEGMYFSLLGIINHLDKLNDYNPEYIAAAASLTTTDSEKTEASDSKIADGQFWSNALTQVKSALQPYVRIQRSAGKAQYLSTEQTRKDKLLDIQLQLRQAQLALISNHDVIYRSAIQSAKISIAHGFPSSSQVDQLNAELTKLENTPLQIESLQINQSIRLLKQLVMQLDHVGNLKKSTVSQ